MYAYTPKIQSLQSIKPVFSGALAVLLPDDPVVIASAWCFGKNVSENVDIERDESPVYLFPRSGHRFKPTYWHIIITFLWMSSIEHPWIRDLELVEPFFRTEISWKSMSAAETVLVLQLGLVLSGFSKDAMDSFHWIQKNSCFKIYFCLDHI